MTWEGEEGEEEEEEEEKKLLKILLSKNPEKTSDLAKGLSQDEDPGVKELPELLKEEDPEKPSHALGEGFGVVVVAHKSDVKEEGE